MKLTDILKGKYKITPNTVITYNGKTYQGNEIMQLAAEERQKPLKQVMQTQATDENTDATFTRGGDTYSITLTKTGRRQYRKNGKIIKQAEYEQARDES